MPSANRSATYRFLQREGVAAAAAADAADVPVHAEAGANTASAKSACESSRSGSGMGSARLSANPDVDSAHVDASVHANISKDPTASSTHALHRAHATRLRFGHDGRAQETTDAANTAGTIGPAEQGSPAPKEPTLVPVPALLQTPVAHPQEGSAHSDVTPVSQQNASLSRSSSHTPDSASSGMLPRVGNTPNGTEALKGGDPSNTSRVDLQGESDKVGMHADAAPPAQATYEGGTDLSVMPDGRVAGGASATHAPKTLKQIPAQAQLQADLGGSEHAHPSPDMSDCMLQQKHALQLLENGQLKPLPRRIVESFKQLAALAHNTGASDEGKMIYAGSTEETMAHAWDAFVSIEDVEMPETMATLLWGTTDLLYAVLEEMVVDAISFTTIGSLIQHVGEFGTTCMPLLPTLSNDLRVWNELVAEVVLEHANTLREPFISTEVEIARYYYALSMDRSKARKKMDTGCLHYGDDAGDDEVPIDPAPLFSIKNMLLQRQTTSGFDQRRYASAFESAWSTNQRKGHLVPLLSTDATVKALHRLVDMADDTLSSSDMSYILDVFELDPESSDGAVSLEDFYVVATLAERIAFVNWAVPTTGKHTMQKSRASGDVMKQKLKSMWALNNPNAHGQVSLANLEISFKAGQMDELAISSIMTHLRGEQGYEALDFFAFVSYVPLFSEIHSAITDAPLSDTPRLLQVVDSALGHARSTKCAAYKWKQSVKTGNGDHLNRGEET